MATVNLPGLEEFIASRIEFLFYEMGVFVDGLEHQIAVMTANGMSSSQIAFALNQDYVQQTGAFGQLKNSTKANIVGAINGAARLGQYNQYTEKNLFAWVTVGGHKICIDCEGRTGQVFTYEEWESEGLPGSGWSVCKAYCYCALDPTGKIGNKINVNTQNINPEHGYSLG